MKLFTDVKIGKRLAIGFGVTLGLMVVIVITGITSLSSITNKLDRVIVANSVKIKLANDIRDAIADIGRFAGVMVATEDAGSKEDAKTKIGEARGRYKKSVDELERLETTGEAKTLIADLKEQIGKGKDENNKTIELAMSGNMAEATKHYQEVARIIQACIGIADKIVEHGEKRTQSGQVEAKQSALTARTLFIILGVVTLLLGIWLSRATTKSIAIPIVRSSAHIDLMAQGDFSIPVSEDAMKRKDEMGIFARSMDKMNKNLGQVLKEVMSSAANVAASSEQLRVSAESLSGGAVNQVEMAAQVATAATEMNQATEDIALNSNRISESAGETVKIAKGGQEIVHRAIQEVNLLATTVDKASEFVAALGQQSGKIGDIVTTINDIADQTNLLALNAAIEAARAGEHGRGFAVVADEVKKLAERTSSSTTEIGNMINTINQGIGKTVESMNQAKRNVESGVQFSSQAQVALQEIITSIDTLYGGVQQTATAIEEMSATTNEITRDINTISEVTQATLTASEEISGAALGLSGLSKELKGTIQTFKV